jgi:4-aminobutyrate aminotransferase-like enzyme
MGAGIFGNVIRFLPPLVITDDQLNVAMDAFAAALAEVLDH